MNPRPQTAVAEPNAPPRLTQDLYPSVTKFDLNPKVATVMRQHGMNPTMDLQRLDKAHASGDYDTKARLLNQFAYLTDTIQGGQGAAGWLDAQRLQTQEEATPVYNSVSTGQAIRGTIYNGLVETVGAVPKLLVAGAGLTHAIDKDQWTRANAGIDSAFDGLKTYVSSDYKKPLATYDDNDGLQFDLNFKSFVGTFSELAGFMLPGLLTAGTGALATTGARKLAVSGATALARAEAGATLGRAASTIKYLTGAEAFLQTFPTYQREALANGLDIHDATLWALPVAGINAVIETANVGNLTKALGISEKAVKSAIREVSIKEATDALLKLPQGFTADMLVETGRAASKKALGIIERPQEIGAFGKLLSGAGRRLGRGFVEQGIPEGAEEFWQGTVDTVSKMVYNNMADADSTGRFKDPTWGGYAFDSIYGTTLGLLLGTAPGAFLQTKQADPTVFGYVGAAVRHGLRKGLDLDTLLAPEGESRLQMLDVLDNKLSTGDIDEATHADMTGKVSRMAGIAKDFADVDGFSEADQRTMYSVSEARYKGNQNQAAIDEAKTQLSQLDQASSDPNLSMGEKLKTELARGQIQRTLGGLVDAPDGSGGQVYMAEGRQQQRTAQVENVISQAMEQYAGDVDRKAINSFVSDNLTKIERDYGKVSYDDDFKPAKIVADPNTGKTVVTDNGKLVFRNLERSGGRITTPAMIDADGLYVPAVRETQADNFAVPVNDLNTHLTLATAVSDRNNPLEAEDYHKPDNSVEGGWLQDGRELVSDFDSLASSKQKGKKKSLEDTKRLASAYLNNSVFLAQNPGYAESYTQVATDLATRLSAVQPANIAATEDNAQPIGDEVDLLAEGIASGELTPLEDGTVVPTESFQPQIDTTNESTTNPPPVSLSPDLGTVTQQPQTEQQQYDDGLQRAVIEEQREDAGRELQQIFGPVAELAGASGEDARGTDERLAAELERANIALEQELGLHEPAVEQQPADEGTAGAGRSGKAATLKELWPTLDEAAQTRAIEIAGTYLGDVSDETGVSQILLVTKGNFKVNRASFVNASDEANVTPAIARTFFKKDAPGLDQIAAEVNEQIPGATMTEGDVVDFILRYPRGIESVRAENRQRFSDEFRILTGKELTKTSAEATRELSQSGQSALDPVMDEISDFDWDEADVLLSQLSPEDAEFLLGRFEMARQQYGDDWLVPLTQASNVNEVFPDTPQAVSTLLNQATDRSQFGQDKDYLYAVQDYLQDKFPTPTYEPIPEYRPAEPTGTDRGAEITDAQDGTRGPDRGAAEGEEPAIQRPAPVALEGAANALALESEGESDTDPTLAPAVVAEIEQQISEIAETDPRTAEATAPVDIAIANEQKQQEAIQNRLDNLTNGIYFAPNSETMALRIENGEAVESGQYDRTTKTFTPNGFSLTEKGTSVYNDVQAFKKEQKQAQKQAGALAGSQKKQADLQAEKLTVIERAVSSSQPNNSTPPAPVEDVSVDIGLKTGYNPLYLREMATYLAQSGITPEQIEQASKRIIGDADELKAAFPSLSAEGQAFLIERFYAGVTPIKFIRAADEVRSATVKQNVQTKQSDAPFVVGDELTIPSTDSKGRTVNRPGKVIVVKGNLVTVYLPTTGREQVYTVSQLESIAHKGVPQFQLNESPSQSNIPLSPLTARLSEAFGVRVVSDPDAFNQALTDSGARKLIGNRTPVAFRWKGSIYLSPDADAGSLLHEAGGLLAEIMRVNAPELFQRGVTLVRDSGYLKRIARDPFYSKLSRAEQEIEAIETAIGDLGARFVTESRRSAFRELLADLWSRIKSVLGIQTDAPIESMTLNDFVEQAVGQLLSGEVKASATENVAFQVTPYTKFNFKGDSYSFSADQNGAGERQENYRKNGEAIDRTAYESALRRADILSPQTIPYNIQRAGELNKDALRSFVKELTTRLPDKVYDESAFDKAFSEVVGKTPSFFGKETDNFSHLLAWEAVRRIYDRLPDGNRADILQWEDRVVQFQLAPTGDILGSTPTTFAQLMTDAEGLYRNPSSFATTQPGASSRNAPTGVSTDLYDKASGRYSAADKAYIKLVTAQTGFELTGAGKLTYVRSNNLYHLSDGRVVRLEQSDVSDVVENTFGKLYADNTHRGKLYQFVTNWLKPWTNTTSFAELIDDSAGTLRALIRDVQLSSARKANFVKNLLQDKLRTAEQRLAAFDEAKLTVQSYDFDPQGQVITTEKELPLTTVMELIALGETQMASYKNKRATHVFDTPPVPNELYDREPSGKLTRKLDHGAQVYDQASGRTDTIFLPRAEFNRLKDRFTTGNGAATGELEAYSALMDFFNQQAVADALKQEQAALNPDEEFVQESLYYPIRTAGGDSNARYESQGRVKLYDKSKRLHVRSGTPKGIVAGNPVQTMYSYSTAVGDIIEYSRLTENLKHIKDALADKYQGDAKKQITDFLSKRISDLETHREKVRAAREESPGIALLEKSMRRYTTSIFALNIGLPAKQLSAAMAVLNQGILDTPYLLSGKNLSVLAKLAYGAYRDATVSASVRADGSEEGLSGGIVSKSDTLERPYLEEMLGANLAPDMREAQQRRFASVINRMLDSTNHYVGDVTFDDLGLNEKTLTSSQKLLKKYDQFAGDRLMAANRRADRAPVIYYYEVAKSQAEGEGLTAGSEPYWNRVADLTERAMSETYNLDNLAEVTATQLSTNFFFKIIGQYSAQQQKLGNLLIKSMIGYAKAEPGTPEAIAARSKLLHTLAWGIGANALYVSSVSAATSVLMALLSGDEPKEPEELIEAVEYGTVRNVIGTYPGIATLVAEYFLNATDPVRGNEDMIDVTALNNFKSAADAIIAAGDYMTEEDEKKQERAGDTFVRESINFTAKQIGLPTSATRVIYENLSTDADDSN